MHPDLEKLIDLVLADGVVTEKEREVIFRKAEKLGEDKDEIEIVLDGKIALMNKEKNSASISSAQPNSNKEGEIRRCPSCGAPLPSFVTNCTDCGYEFRNIESSNSIKELLKQLEQADVRAKNAKLGGDFFGAFASIIDKQTVIEKNIYEAKSIVLSTFPIPNTKEDILEFLALSVGQIKSIKIGALEKFGSTIVGASGISGYKINYKNAWLSIANRVIMKARFSMKADKKTLEEIEGYAKELGIK